MTSYTQNDYYFNKIDALSCNNRPISSTLRNKSTFNAYESQTEDETIGYDLYGNQEYNDGSSCDSYKYIQKTTSTTSNAGNYNDFYYCNDYNRYCKNVITTDNLMYHRDACSGDSSDRYDIYDNLRGECFNYSSNADVDENDSQLTSLEDRNNKMLPQVPQVRHTSNVWDGTYCGGQYRQSNVSLPSTPTFRCYDSSVGGREMGADNGDWDRGLTANGIETHLNGHRFYDQNGLGMNGHKPPERILPLPQSQSYVKKSLKQQFFHETSDDMAANTTSTSVYRNPINLEFKRAMPVSSANQNFTSRSPYYDKGSIDKHQLNSQESNYSTSCNIYASRYSIESRPHTAMQTMEEYNEFGLNSIDNMSTYSDSTIPTGATTYANQQKLQDLQKCRYSIIMAMTTASVIASGETRIPQHLLKKPPKTSANAATSIATTVGLTKPGVDACMTSNNSLNYDDSSGFVNKNSNSKINSLNGSNNLTPCAYTNVTMIPNQSLVNLPQTVASSSILLLSSASPIVADNTVSNITSTTTAISSNMEITSDSSLVKSFTSRKLPKYHTSRGLITSKQLPHSPLYTLVKTNVSGKTLPDTPQASSLKSTTDTLDNIKIESSILSTTLPSTTPSSISSTFSLLSYQGSTSLTSSSLIKSAATTDGLTAGASSSTILSTTASYLFPNNNNTELNTEMKNYENLNNYKNNNFFCNNAQNIDDKYSIKSLCDSKETDMVEKVTEATQQHDSIYHLSTTPSRLSSLESPNDKQLQQSNQFITGMAYDSIISMPSSPVTTTKGETSNTSITAATTAITTSTTFDTFPTLSDSKSMLLINSDYKTTYDYDYSDYLKPYTLPTCFTTISNSNNTNLQYTLTNTNSSISSNSYLPYSSVDIHSSYLAFSSPIITNTSTTLPPAFTSSSSIITTSTNLAINNRELNKFTALNLSDNISRKSSISSPVSKIASPNESIVTTPPISYHSTTPAIATTLSFSSQASEKTDMLDQVSTSYSTQLQEEKNNSKISLDLKTDTKMSYSPSLLYKKDYDYYLKDYKLDFVSPTKMSSSELSSMTQTSATTTASLIPTTASSSSLNKSWPITTTSTTLITTDTITNSLNNNEVIDVTRTALPSISPNCLFTTTKPTAEVTSTKDGSLVITAASLTSALYADYLKDYSTVTASSSSSFISELTGKSSSELPAYIMDFLVTSKSNEFDSNNYLNLYKIKEVDTITDTITSDASSLKTTNNNNLTSSENFLSDIPSTTIPAVSDGNKSAVVEDIPSNIIPDISDGNKSAIVEKDPVTKATTCKIVITHTEPAVMTSDFITTSSPIHIVPATTTTEHQLTANTALNSVVDFDDNFYSSFSVNLNSLMGDTLSPIVNSAEKTISVTSEAEKPSLQLETSFNDTLTALDYPKSDNTNKSLFETSINGSKTSTSFKTVETTKPTSEAAKLPVESKTLSSNTHKPSTASAKATSMLGGLSQSLKGGLDGVLAVAASNEPQQQKRGFGFGLASKLVPSVGGLLGSAAKSTAATTTADRPSPKIVVTVSVTNQQSQVLSESLNDKVDTISTAFTSPNIVTSSLSENYSNGATSSGTVIIATSDNKDLNYVISTQSNEKNGGGTGGLYYNSSEPTYYHMTSSVDYAQDEMTSHAEQITVYDDAVTGDFSGAKNYYVDENQAIDMYDGYSEYSAVATSGHLVDPSAYMSVTTSDHLVTASDQVVDTTAVIAYPTSSELTTAQLITTTVPESISTQSSNSATVTAAKKATSSLFSSLTNVASQISNQTSSSAPAATSATAITFGSTTNAKGTKVTNSGGMFGSIFGKAAAAVQTATQVVNQGASMASTKVQKNLQPNSSASTIHRVPTKEENVTCVVTSATRAENICQRSVLSQQNSLASPYASSLGGDDYDNSNIPKTDGEFHHQLQEDEYYYTNQNQPTHLVHQQKVLPTVPPGGGSTGKKLPTINDKSGCLRKPQPSEIYDEDAQVLGNKSQSYLKRVPTYAIDSEQADYYMDAQPVAPSPRHMAANGYYEHTNGGSYDYRDDYFNEEDELNYLEKEKILENKQQQQQLRQIQKQTSVQYVVGDDFQEEQNEIIDEYIEDMYHSEDSGNYLDESSSGSVQGLTSHQQMPTTTAAALLQHSNHQMKSSTATTPATSTTTGPITPHQQIKKQDSIILEEDEKAELSTISGLPDTAASPSKSLSRKSSYDILGAEDDQMGDLQTVSASLRSSQSRKIKLMRGETEEVVSGHMQIMKRKTEVTAKQRWHWAYNKIIMQLNVSRNLFYLILIYTK